MTTLGTTLAGPISGEDYMLVLAARQAAYMAARPESGPLLRFPPLLEWFIRDGDEQYVALPESAPVPKRPPTPRAPRKYRSADSIRAKLETVTRQLDAIGANDSIDNAVVNIGPSSRNRAVARAGRARFARMDRDLERYTQLAQRRNRLAGHLASAEARESRDASLALPAATPGGAG